MRTPTLIILCWLIGVIGCEAPPSAPTSDDTASTLDTTQTVTVVVDIHGHDAPPPTAPPPPAPTPNRPPVLESPGPQTSIVGVDVSLLLRATDPDGDELTWMASGLPRDLTISPGTGVISGTVTPSSAAPGDSPFVAVVAVSDGQGGSDSVSFLWVVVAAAP